MCTRYTIVSSSAALEEEFQAEFKCIHQKNYNAHFSLDLPVIRSGEDDKIVTSRWGLIPYWAKEPNLKFHNINALARNIVKHHAYRIPIRRRRCLVLANCYFIWSRASNQKTPYVVYDSKHRIMSFAGIWDTWINSNKDAYIESYAIITTHANKRIRNYTQQAPVIIPPGRRREFLKISTPLNEIMPMLRPFDSDSINLYPVSSAVDDFHNTKRDVVMPIGERVYKEYTYSSQVYLKLEGMGSMKDNPERKPEIKTMI